MLTKKEIRFCLDEMGKMFPDAHCELVHQNPFELLVAVVLSAQTTDASVNKVTKTLFQKYKTPEDYIQAPLANLEQDIRTIGLYRTKAKNIQKLCQKLLDEHDGQVPQDLKQLMALPVLVEKLPMSSAQSPLGFRPLPSIPMWKGLVSDLAFVVGKIRFWKWRKR